jgi:hypothetical protein
VYPAHASGIGISLVAANVLSEVLKEAAGDGEDVGAGQVLARFGHRFHRRHGSLLANSDASRRFSQNLTKEETHVLISRRMMSRKMIGDSLMQMPVGLHLPDLPWQLVQSVRHPLIAKRVLTLAAKIPLISTCMRLYPKMGSMDPEKLSRFEQRLERLVDF